MWNRLQIEAGRKCADGAAVYQRHYPSARRDRSRIRLAARFGVEEGQIENLIVVNVDGMKVGLEVGRVKEIVDVENAGMLPMPVLVNSEKKLLSRRCFLQKGADRCT